MGILLNRERLVFHLRMWALPILLIAVYALQLEFTAIHRYCALWSDHPRWWQFFSCNFLSNDLWHLSVNAGGLLVVYSQFVPRVRFPFLAVAFIFFSTLSTWVFHEWWMPEHAWLIGASGGSYALLGFFSWFLRRARFHLHKFKRLQFPILPVLVVILAGEYLFARWRMPGLAWQLHAIGFGLGLGGAVGLDGFVRLLLGFTKTGFGHSTLHGVFSGLKISQEEVGCTGADAFGFGTGRCGIGRPADRLNSFFGINFGRVLI